MKVDVMDLQGKKVKSVELPNQFEESFEPNLVKRAVLAFMSAIRSPYGAMPGAGFRHSAKLSRRRKDYKTPYGKGVSRVPRKTMWRRGMQFGWVGAEVSGTVGGRRAHPPVSWKNWLQKINKKEKSKAIRSALGGLAEYKKITVIEDGFENLKKTKEVQNTILKLGFEAEIKRLGIKKVRAGKGTMRGRKYKNKVGPLVVLSKDSDTLKAANNLQGFDVEVVDAINIRHLIKGHETLRDTIWTEAAIKKVKSEGLFRGKK